MDEVSTHAQKRHLDEASELPRIVEFRGATTPDLPSSTLESVLETLENAVHYRNWIFSLSAPYLGSRVLELGAGCGTMFSCISDRELAVGLELDVGLAGFLKDRFGANANALILQGSVTDGETVARLLKLNLDSAMSVNVLEHIDDDVGALGAIASVLNPGNMMTVFVPAFPNIFGAMDSGVGHVRRYRKRELVAKVQSAGFSIVDVHYVNMPGYFAWYFNGRVLRHNQPLGGSRMVTLYDRTVIIVTRLIESIAHPPFGQSLFLAARRD